MGARTGTFALFGALHLRQSAARRGQLCRGHFLVAAGLKDLPEGDRAVLPEGVQPLALLAGEVQRRCGAGDGQLQARHIRLAAQPRHQVGEGLTGLHPQAVVGEAARCRTQMRVDGRRDMGTAVGARPQDPAGGHRAAQDAPLDHRRREVRQPLLLLRQLDAVARRGWLALVRSAVVVERAGLVIVLVSMFVRVRVDMLLILAGTVLMLVILRMIMLCRVFVIRCVIVRLGVPCTQRLPCDRHRQREAGSPATNGGRSRNSSSSGV